ncbi:MAG: hypothetical protein KKH61_10245, partial [Gammaproteobacteria bacterium]|nr:hypothetical protein [Gammaproteobacteria bacterium]
RGKRITDHRRLAPPLEAVKTMARRAGPRWEVHLPVVLDGVTRYAQQYAAERLEVVFVEDELRANIHCNQWLNSPFLYTQRGDWGSIDVAGRVRLHDVKTCGRYTAATLRRYLLSGQFLGYWHFGKRQWGDKFGGCVVEFVEMRDGGKVHRKTWPYAPAAIERYFRDMAYWERNRRELDGMVERGELAADDYPGSWSEFHCNGPYGLCPGADSDNGAPCARGIGAQRLGEVLSGAGEEDEDDYGPNGA